MGGFEIDKRSRLESRLIVFNSQCVSMKVRAEKDVCGQLKVFSFKRLTSRPACRLLRTR